jgi:L-alanine-DL-glutamate epimerase-like enolase superfamily enzyme
MKIRGVQTTRLSVPLPEPLADATHTLPSVDWILVDIHTDNGLTGHAHMLTFDYGPELLMGIVDHELKDVVIGMDPTLIEKAWQACWQRVEYIGQTGVAAWGIAAIDIALWDILGQSLNCPVHKLLGAYQEEVPIYGSGGWLSYSLDQLVQEARNYVKRGFTTVKMKVGSREPERDVERVRAVRHALGPKIQLMIDANQAWTPWQALEFSRKVEGCDIFWFEEPIPKDDLDGYEMLAGRMPIPVAAGEREYSLQVFRQLLERRALPIVQPDVLRLGGISRCIRLAHLAETFHARVASHFYKEIDIHWMAAAPHGLFLEYFPWLDPLLVHPLEISNGMAKVPTRPGLSIEIQPEAVREYKVS